MFAELDFDSFFSVWYWVVSVLVWTLVCHRTLGVPYDMLLRARCLPAVAAEVETIARLTAARLASIYRTAGVWLAAAAGFGLAALAVLAFARVEAARAALMLLLPLAGIWLATARLALRIDGGRAGGEALRQSLARRRAWNQAIAIAAILAAALVALAHHPRLAFG